MFHKVTGIGRLGRDPDFKFLPSGTGCANMNVAVNRTYTDSNAQKITETIWIRLVAWGNLAENCNQYLAKGKMIFFEGRLNADTETGGPKLFTRKDGTVGSNFEVTVQNVIFLSSKSEDQAYQGQNQSGFSDDVDEDDIPF